MARIATSVRPILVLWLTATTPACAVEPLDDPDSIPDDVDLEQEELAATTAGGGTERPAAERACYDLVQGRIAWDPSNTQRSWSADHVWRLCAGTQAPREPGACFDRVMHGRVSWSTRRPVAGELPATYRQNTTWTWENALRLCAGTNNAFARVGCFTDRLIRGDDWSAAIARCAPQVERAPSCNVPDPMWDWTSPGERFDVYPTAGGVVQCGGPFGNQCGVQTLRADSVLPRDGWVLLYKELGSPGCTTTVPKFALYNTLTGTLRIFYFIPHLGQSFTHLVTEVSQAGPGSRRAIFPFGRRSYTLASFDATAVESAVHSGPQHQWTYADIPLVGYDPRVPDQDTELRFRLVGVTDAQLRLEGSVQLEQLQRDQAGGTTSDLLSSGVTALREGYRYYQSAGDLQNWARGKAWVMNDPTLQTLASSSALPVVAGLAGAVTSFILGGDDGAGPIKFSGNLGLTGTMTTRYEINTSFALYLPGAPLRDPGSDKRPYYDQPIGVYNLRQNPTGSVYYNPGTLCSNAPNRIAFKLESVPVVVNPVGPGFHDITVGTIWDLRAGRSGRTPSAKYLLPTVGSTQCFDFSNGATMFDLNDSRLAFRMKVVAPSRRVFEIMNVTEGGGWNGRVWTPRVVGW